MRIRCGKRRSDGMMWLAVAVGLSMTAGVGPRPARGETEPVVAEVNVARTYDGRPFVYRVEGRTEGSGYSVLHLSYPSPVSTAVPQNNTIPAEYYLPQGIRPGDARRPAVICLHILDGNLALVRLTCSVLANRGVPAILFLLPYYGPRALPDGPQAMAKDPKLFLGAIAQGVEDVKRTVDVLDSRPEVDATKIGITGISLGGIAACTAACNDVRLSRALLVLAGGDLPTIIHHARETRDLCRLIDALPQPDRAEVDKAIEAVDPLRNIAALRSRAEQDHVMMVNAEQDEVIPRSCTDKLATALGMSNRVLWLDDLGHYSAMAELPRLLATTADFFARDLPPGVSSPVVPPADEPLKSVLRLMRETSACLLDEPSAGRCHVVDLDLTVARRQADFQTHVRYVRGNGGRFKLELRLPFFGQLAVGQAEYPWMVTAGPRLLKGVLPAAAGSGDASGFGRSYLSDRLRMVGGGLKALILAPDVVGQLAEIHETAAPDERTLALTIKDGTPGSLTVTLDTATGQPKSAAYQARGMRGRLAFHSWQIDAAADDALLVPPAGLQEKQVTPQEVYTTFSTMIRLLTAAM